jgi:hypothetical protein
MCKRANQRRWTDHSFFLFEKDLFVAFFLVRKLIECRTKISKAVDTQTVTLDKFSASGKAPTVLSNHKLDELYRLDKGHKVTKSLGFVCGQFVHSYAFIPVMSHQSGIDGVLFNSFNERVSALYQISMDEIIRLLSTVSNDSITKLQMTLNSATRDYEIDLADG